MSSPMERMIRERMEVIRSKGRLRTLRAVRRVSPRECVIDGKKLIDFSSNDYMGLSMRPELIRGAVEWTERFGTSCGASRLISGTSGACLELEEKIAAWKGFEGALILSSGYAANVGIVSALAGRGSAVFADKLNHASINTGCLLSQAEFRRYRHSDTGHLEKLLAMSQIPEKLVASDTVFSMDGDLAPLSELFRLSREHGAMLFLDDAHGTGVTGVRGKGLASPENCDVALATFSKAMGAFGGCILCSRELREYFINVCSPFIFSTGMPPSTLGAISAAVDLIQTPEMEEARSHLHALSGIARDAIRSLGFDCGSSETMILPVIIGDATKTLEFSRRLYEKGILALAVRPPTVPDGTSRIRVSLNADHAREDVQRLIDALAEIKKETAE